MVVRGIDFASRVHDRAATKMDIQARPRGSKMKLIERFWLSVFFCVVSYTPSASATLLDGIVAAYSFEGNASDVSGNGNNGIVAGAIPATDRNGNPNSAFFFDGSDASIDIGNGVKPPLPLTVNLWFNSSSLGTYPLFRNDQVDGGSFRHGVFLGTSERKLFMQVFSGFAVPATRKGVITVDDVFVADEWNMFTAVYDGLNDFRIYLDGIEAIVEPTSGTGNAITYSAANGAIGSVNDTLNNSTVFTSNFFHGFIDDVCVYNRALSDAEIMQLVGGACFANGGDVPEPTTAILLIFGLAGTAWLKKRCENS